MSKWLGVSKCLKSTISDRKYDAFCEIFYVCCSYQAILKQQCDSERDFPFNLFIHFYSTVEWMREHLDVFWIQIRAISAPCLGALHGFFSQVRHQVGMVQKHGIEKCLKQFYPNHHIEQCTWDVGIFHLVMLLDKEFTTVDTVHTDKYPVGFSCGVLSGVITSIFWRRVHFVGW